MPNFKTLAHVVPEIQAFIQTEMSKMLRITLPTPVWRTMRAAAVLY